MKISTNSKKQQGVTLIELVISIVVLSIAMVAMMNSFSLSMSHSADPLWRNKTLKLAQLYLDEILAKNYDELTPVGGMPYEANPSCASLGENGTEIRATYDDVDDYNGSTGGVTHNPPTSIDGSLDPSYAQFSVRIVISCDGARVGALDDAGASANNHAKKITVTVAPFGQSVVSPLGENAIVFAAYKGNY